MVFLVINISIPPLYVSIANCQTFTTFQGHIYKYKVICLKKYLQSLWLNCLNLSVELSDVEGICNKQIIVVSNLRQQLTQYFCNYDLWVTALSELSLNQPDCVYYQTTTPWNYIHYFLVCSSNTNIESNIITRLK